MEDNFSFSPLFLLNHKIINVEIYKVGETIGEIRMIISTVNKDENQEEKKVKNNTILSINDLCAPNFDT